jgi:hypothetical protein
MILVLAIKALQLNLSDLTKVDPCRYFIEFPETEE